MSSVRVRVQTFRLGGVVSLFLALCWSCHGAAAQTIDPHSVYEQRCGGCHRAHAGEFARESLIRRGAETVGRKSGKDIRKFLADGHGRLTAREAVVLAAHLAFVVEAGGVFRDRCVICHGRGVDFARQGLTIENGRVTGLYSGRDIETFLRNHGRLTVSDRGTILRMLRRQLATGSKPQE